MPLRRRRPKIELVSLPEIRPGAKLVAEARPVFETGVVPESVEVELTGTESARYVAPDAEESNARSDERSQACVWRQRERGYPSVTTGSSR
jgi:hypothetical protein